MAPRGRLGSRRGGSLRSEEAGDELAALLLRGCEHRRVRVDARRHALHCAAARVRVGERRHAVRSHAACECKQRSLFVLVALARCARHRGKQRPAGVVGCLEPSRGGIDSLRHLDSAGRAAARVGEAREAVRAHAGRVRECARCRRGLRRRRRGRSVTGCAGPAGGRHKPQRRRGGKSANPSSDGFQSGSPATHHDRGLAA